MSDTTIKIEGFAEQDLPHDLARLAEYLAEEGEVEASDLIKTAIAAFERGRIAGHEDGAVPDGWKLVPIEPTEEMHNAARDWSILTYDKAIGVHASLGCYISMINAAPPAPETKK